MVRFLSFLLGLTLVTYVAVLCIEYISKLRSKKKKESISSSSELIDRSNKAISMVSSKWEKSSNNWDIDGRRWEYCQIYAFAARTDKKTNEIIEETSISVVSPNITKKFRGKDIKLHEILGNLGQDGWEAFSHSMTGDTLSVFLRRPLTK
jgi:hypothetical protein